MRLERGLLRVLVKVLAVFGVAGCGCPEYPCEPRVHLNGKCATTKNCQLDGRTVTECECCGETPNCPLWDLPTNTMLAIPLVEFWPSLGKRDDLRISATTSAGAPDLRNTTLLFNGQPATQCVHAADEITCNNLPRTIRQLEFRLDDPRTDRRFLTYLDMRDADCESTHERCPG